MNNNQIILFCGLMGGGKTTISKFFLSKLKDYERFNTDDVRKILGFKTFDRKDTPVVNEYMYSRAKNIIAEGKGVIFDSAYKLKEAREKIYGIAKKLSVPVLVIECYCSQKTALKRISSRTEKDDFHTPTNDTEVYKQYAKIWESPAIDSETNENISLIRINTDDNKIERIKISNLWKKEIEHLINRLESYFVDFNIQ